MTRATPRTSIAAPTDTDARNYVAAPSGVTTEQDMADIGQQAPRMLSSTGAAKDALDRPVFEKVSEAPMDGEWMAMMDFLKEPVEIHISENGDPEAEQVFEVNVCGRLEFFRRGETKTVPRYIVDRLLRMKETKYRQKLVTVDGIQQYQHLPVTTLKYDFAITGDRNPLGPAWRQAVRAEIG